MFCFSRITRGFVIAVLVAIVFSCNNTQESKDDLITIDVEKAYNEPMRDIMLSEVVENIEYLKLETGSDCLIGRVGGVAISNNYIVVYEQKTKTILLFSKSGAFLHRIGSIGRGPGEYNFVSGNSLEIISDEKFILFKDYSNSIYLYNIDGTFHKKIKAPARKLDGFGYRGPGEIVVFQNIAILPEEGACQLITYDENLNIVDSSMFSEKAPNPSKGPSMFKQVFTIYQKELYYSQILNDTIFKNEQSKVVFPWLIINMSSLKPPSIQTSWDEIITKYLSLDQIQITDSYLFLTFVGLPRVPKPNSFGVEYLIYNKTSGETFFLDEYPNPYVGEAQMSSAPINDLDALHLNPDILFYLRNGVTWDAIEIADAKPFFESDDFDSTKLSTDKYYKKVKKLLDESDIEDNPIIRICYLK